MAKYKKRTDIIEAELFKRGMEDGYGAYRLSFNNEDLFPKGDFIGYFEKDQPLPKVNLIPAIKSLGGWSEAIEGKHYIVTWGNGERVVVNKDTFEELFELVEE